jgi:UDP-MurNAc hydroxylase
MEIKKIKSSTVVVESGGTSVLCDPWLVDGAFLGSWAHYPPLEYEPEDFDDIDFIYISHIHPDHCHVESLKQLDRDIPVYIHDFQWDFLKQNIERLGFTVKEIPHAERIQLGSDLYLNILAADDCDPEICGNYFGCQWYAEAASDEQTDGSTQIDSLAVFDDGESVVVNANDCRWPLSRIAAEWVKEQYIDIDLLLMQYSPASGYPQCRFDYTAEKKEEAGAQRREEMYDSALSFIDIFEPNYYMPFAGSYVLSGKYYHLNAHLPNPTLSEAKQRFQQSTVTNGCKCVLLNSGDAFDITRGIQSSPYEPIDPEARDRYIISELPDRTYEYESDDKPQIEEFKQYSGDAFEHFESKRQEIGYESEADVFVRFVDDTYMRMPLDGTGFDYVNGVPEQDGRKQYIIRSDPKLMLRILKGPKHAHFNNAEIGSHIHWAIRPDVYERAVFYCLSFFHS